MVQHLPPLGWNSWNTFGNDISDSLIRETADVMVSSGLLDCGYNYLVIDDCWSEKLRDKDGRLVPDKKKFPNGMKAVADYVHSKGLKFGMYSCAGTMTCAGYPASFEHEFTDAATFAEWGVDYLKYDYCFHPQTIPGHVLYKRMGLALANCGRDILFSGCSWGADQTRKWIKSTGTNIWRSTGDINDSWWSIKELAMQIEYSMQYSAINCFADLDMLVVGMGGKGNVGHAGCTEDEYKLHFSLWALLNSPLMIGCDIRNMDETTKKILMNKDVLAINQDPACRQAYNIRKEDMFNQDAPVPGVSVYVKHLDNGDLAIGIFNFEDNTATRWFANIPLDVVGLPESTGKTLSMTELWTGEKCVIQNGFFETEVAPHACKLYRCKVIDK